MAELTQTLVEHLFANIDKIHTKKISIDSKYLRRIIYFHSNIIIDNVIIQNDLNQVFSMNEGEELDYLDEQLTSFNDEDSKIQSMGC